MPTRGNTNWCVFSCNSKKDTDRNLGYHHFPNMIETTERIGLAWDKALLFMGKSFTKFIRVWRLSILKKAIT